MTNYIVVKGENIEYDDFHRDDDGGTMRDDDWAEYAKGLLRAELKRRGLTYRELAEKLTAMGIPESERNIANKVSRGGFTAAFLIQCMAAIGVDTLRLDGMPKAVEAA